MENRVVTAASMIVVAVGAWIISPRFSIDIPSLTDDWSAIRYAGGWIRDYAHLHDPEPKRFRPGWVVWNYLQWHTFAAPKHMFGPNAWNIARLALLAAGMSLFTRLVIAPTRGRWGSRLLHAALVALPALLVVTTPGIAVDLARFAPQEPALVGGMLLGGSLLLLSGRMLVSGHSWQKVTLLAAGGTVLWLFGVYQKEVSVCGVILLAASWAARPGWLQKVRSLERGRQAAAWALVAVSVLPLAHMAAMALVISRRGAVRYSETPKDWSYAHRVWHLVDEAPSVLGTSVAPWLVALALVGVVVSTSMRRSIDWIPVGLVTTAAATIVMAAQAGAVPSRYYLPALALTFVTLSVLASRLAPRYEAAWVIAGGAIVLAYATSAKSHVETWAEYEGSGAAIISEVERLEETGCPIALKGLYEEHMISLPYLVKSRAGSKGHCPDGASYLVLGLADSNARVDQACTGAESALLSTSVATVYRCSGLRPGVTKL